MQNRVIDLLALSKVFNVGIVLFELFDCIGTLGGRLVFYIDADTLTRTFFMVLLVRIF